MLPKAREPVLLYHSRNGVIGFCGLLCSRLHVMMSWVLNVSITRHDKLSRHPRRHLYTLVIDDYTAWLIHFKTLLYGNLWHSFRLPSPCRGTVDFKCHSNIICVCVCVSLYALLYLRLYNSEVGTFQRSCFTVKEWKKNTCTDQLHKSASWRNEA